MRVFSINNGNSREQNLSFKRKPTAIEYKHYVPTIKEGLKALNKELGFIIHNSSVPSNSKANYGIGSLLSKSACGTFVPFLIGHGFSTIQQEPNYIRRISDPSPYDPLSTSKNIYMFPLEKLATAEYAHILDAETLSALVTDNDEKVDYTKVAENYDKVFRKAYENYNSSNYDGEYRQTFVNDFSEFKTKKWSEIEPNALYEVLTKIHKQENWKKWPEIDKFLFDRADFAPRLKELREKYASEIDFHFFKQWLVEKEIAKTNEINKQMGVSIIADTPIAFTPAEEWLNKDLFLEGLSLGCPPDYFSKNGQRWGFAVIHPHKLFNPDGSLGEAGEFLRKRYEAIFEASPGGVRIDHLIGLIDPFVYLESENYMTSENSGRIYTSPHIYMFKDFGRYTDDDFTAIFEKIIFPAAKKFGIEKDNIICEDLGEQTEPVKRVIEKLGLTGLSLTQFGYSGADAPERNVIMLGAHDNRPYIDYTDELFARASSLGEGRDRFIYKTHILGSDTVIPGKDVNQYREELRSDKKKFMAASFAELFTSPAKKVQIFFTDFFGINKTYNTPGAKKDCWTLRLKSNYEDIYYDNLQKGLAINLPEAIATAIRTKGKDFSNKYADLLRKLDYFTHIFKA